MISLFPKFISIVIAADFTRSSLQSLLKCLPERDHDYLSLAQTILSKNLEFEEKSTLGIIATVGFLKGMYITVIK